MNNNGGAMNPEAIFPGTARQLGFVVDDIDSAMDNWTTTTGIGPWFILRDFGYRAFTHRGESVRPSLAIALSYSGDVQMELIQQMDHSPSMYREFLDAGKTGLQHIAYWPEDVQSCRDAALRADWRIGQSIETPRGPLYYLENSRIDIVIEIAGLTPERQATFDAIRKACADWDGSDPVRESWPSP